MSMTAAASMNMIPHKLNGSILSIALYRLERTTDASDVVNIAYPRIAMLVLTNTYNSIASTSILLKLFLLSVTLETPLSA